MGLQRLAVRENIFQPVLAIGFINFILTMGLLILSTTIFASPSGIQMEFPFKQNAYGRPGHVSTMAGLGGVITVTGENVIYIDGHVVTLNELRRSLGQGSFYKATLMIKVDRRASMGRVADILDICRGLLGAKVNVSTIL